MKGYVYVCLERARENINTGEIWQKETKDRSKASGQLM